MKNKEPSLPVLPVLEPAFLDLEEEDFYEGKSFSQQDVSYGGSGNLILRSCQLEHVVFHKARCERLECSQVVFSHCDLSNVEWLGASLHNVLFSNCKLTGANFSDSYLRDCRFEDCIGEFAAFSNTNMKVVQLENCRLPRSDFFEIEWQHLQLKNCDIDDSNWFRTKLANLDFRSNQFEKIALSQELLKGLKVNQHQAICIAAGLGLQIEE